MRVLFCCVAPVFALSGWAAEPVATRDFARKAEYESAKISPTGDYLAVAAPVGDQTGLGIIDLKNRKLTAGLHFGRSEHITDYWWVSASRVVVEIATRQGPLDQPRLTGELYAINADGSGRAYLFGYRGGQQVGTKRQVVTREYAYAFMADPLPEDANHALVVIWPWRAVEVTQPLIELIDVNSGQRRRVGVIPARAPIAVRADRDGMPRFAYGMDDKSEYLLFARVKEGEAWKRVATPEPSPKNVRLYPLSGDGNAAYFSYEDKAGRACLYEYRFDTARAAELACKNDASISRVDFAFDRSRPTAVVYQGDQDERVALEPEHPDVKLLRVLGNSFKGQRLTVTSQTTDGNKLVLHVESDRNPGTFYLFDRGTNKAEYLISRRRWIEPKAMQPVEPIQYQTRDGATIHGYLTAQAGLRTKKSPLVLLPHGGPHGVRDYWEWNDWAQFLASRGYTVLQPNYRGSGGYGAAFEEAGYRKWGTLMQDDLTDAVRWAVAQGIADPQRVCIFGASYGGYAALMSAVREPDLYRCAVGFAGAYDLASQSEDSETSDTLFGRNYLMKVLGTDEKVLAEQSPVTYIEKLKAPVLIVHGTEDQRVPFSQAKILRKALEKHGKPYEWLEYSGEEHGFYKDENHEDFLNKLAAFLDLHIGSAP